MRKHSYRQGAKEARTLKILFVAPQLPYPLNVGSKIRVYNLLKSYSHRHDVTLITFTRDPGDMDNLSHLEKMCEKAIGVPIDTCHLYNQSPHKIGRVFLRAVERTPYSIKSFVSFEMQRRISEEIESGAYDALHVEKVFMTANVRPMRRKAGQPMVTLLDVDDIDSRKARRHAQVMPFSKEKLREYLDSVKLHFYERKAFDRYDCCFVCSEIDKSLLEAREFSTSIEVIPNGIDMDGKSGSPEIFGRENTILFVGSMSYEPNEDAALYFVKSIFPLVKAKVREARFIIAGKEPTEAVRRLHNGNDICVTGYVPDVKEVYAKSTIVAVPIRVGGGTRIKILEAMSLGVPVVSTSIGCEGIEVVDGRDMLVADSPEHFAAQCALLLSDRHRREMLASNAKAVVAQKYGWKGIGEKLNGILEAQFEKRNNIFSGKRTALSPQEPSVKCRVIR